MKRFLIPLLAVCAISAPSYATDPPAPAPIILPDPTPIAPPPTPPSPNATTKLGGDQFYVIRSEVPIIVVTSPSGVVKSSTETGPIKIKGKFTDGDGTSQCRSYTNKYVTILEAAGTGTVELLVIPAGATDQAVVIRRTLDVSSSVVPPTPPTPPTPPADPLTLVLQVAATADGDPKSLVVLKASYASMAASAPLQSFKTNADAVAWIRTQVGLPSTALPNMKKVIAAELSSAFGTSASAAVDPAAFAAELKKISAALNGVK